MSVLVVPITEFTVSVVYKHGYPCDTVIAARTDSKQHKYVVILALRFFYVGPRHCLNVVSDANSEPQTCQCRNVSPHHFPYIDKLCSLPWKKWHGHLSLTDEPFINLHQTRFLFFETTLQIPCDSGRCVPHKNGVF